MTEGASKHALGEAVSAITSASAIRDKFWDSEVNLIRI